MPLGSLSAKTPAFFQWLWRAKGKISLAGASMLVTLIVAEIAIRIFDPLGISYFEEAKKYHLDKIPDPVLVFKHAPNLRKKYQGVDVFTNNLGLRDRELGKKLKGELRILLLGDSVTFGWGVPIEQTFGRRLESLLSSQLQRPVRTVNSGVGSYNTVQEYASLGIYSGPVQPDAVVLLYVDNDIEVNDPPFDPRRQTSLRGKPPAQVVSMLLQKSRLYRMLIFVTKYAHPSAPPPLDHNSRGVAESFDALRSIAESCRRHRIPFAVFFYRPARESKPVAEYRNQLLKEIRKLGTLHQFPVTDTGSWWGNADMQSVTNSVVDSHPNPRGHALLAQGMAGSLKDHLPNK